MPPKKRRKRDHPKVEQYMAVATLSSALAKLAQQEQQYVALLRQVAGLTEHEAAHPEKQWFAPEFEFAEDTAQDVSEYVQQWLKEISELGVAIQERRDDSIAELRKVDVLDNDALKNAALSLTECETQLNTIQNILSRWSKIVRHKKGTDLQKHTKKWIERWLTQWRKTHASTQKLLIQFRESLDAPLLRDILAVPQHN